MGHTIQNTAAKRRRENQPFPTENALGVRYYDFRRYEMDYGRCIGRYPIEEIGGLLNLYSNVGNEPLVF